MAPFIHLTDTVSLPTYLLIISLAYTIAVIWAFYRAPKLNMERAIALDLGLMIMMGGFFGARLFHIFYENFDYYMLFPWDVFKIWQGGFVFYGGFIGALLACIAYAKLRKIDFWEWADFYAPILAFGYGFGRLGCFLNGCCFGAECDLPWAIEFTQAGLPTGLRHPTQLYATVWELVLTLPLLLYVFPKFKFPRTGYIFLSWLLLHATGRFIMESFREDFRGGEIVGLSVSTWISIAIILVSLGLVWRRQQSTSQ